MDSKAFGRLAESAMAVANQRWMQGDTRPPKRRVSPLTLSHSPASTARARPSDTFACARPAALAACLSSGLRARRPPPDNTSR
ncbi:hypothetical protein EVAR_29851_1 [Eumeta japonica]|uniref:Uncharacterized protein n=1 Tax=Eumeta variegata TaxID=151549 RepID=A0A4C1VU64_EUMVA|nr:hypothetical protein EVAR_29851_1 [Eumeta japonica]